MSWEKSLYLKQVDGNIALYKGLRELTRPGEGWIRTVRNTLGMNARQLAERIGVKQPSVVGLEKQEAAGSITLNTLEKAAQGLGCRVVYALVPAEADSLASLREAQAEGKAASILGYTAHQMALEDQATSESFDKESFEQLKKEFIEKWPRDFWDE